MQNDMPLVSVAIITYNQKKYLKECIESVLKQDYPNIEIVIGDDASTDGTQEMLEEYIIQYPNKFILKLSKTNQGITKNSNLVHFACTGKYIAWMGGDDLMLPGKIRKQVEYMEKHLECTICYHNLEVFDSDSGKILYYFNEKNKYEGDVRTAIKYGTFNGACSSMVRANKTPMQGFNTLVPVASDWLYWVESLHNGGTINYINEVLGKYRRHDNNITKKSGIQNSIDHLNSCNIILMLSPDYLNYSVHRQSIIIASLRHKLIYKDALILSLKLKFSTKVMFAFTIYIITFGKIKL